MSEGSASAEAVGNTELPVDEAGPAEAKGATRAVVDGGAEDGPVSSATDDQTVTGAESEQSAVAEDVESGTATGERRATARDDEDAEVAAEAGSSVDVLEREGDIAADYVEELLDIVDLDGDLDIDVESERAIVSVVGEGVDTLVGRDGQTLEALQELTRLAVWRETGDRSRLMLDIAGFRASRRAALERLGAEVADEVRKSGEPKKLEPMSAFERKVVHDAVAAAGLQSESEGEAPDRCVVVRPV